VLKRIADSGRTGSSLAHRSFPGDRERRSAYGRREGQEEGAPKRSRIRRSKEPRRRCTGNRTGKALGKLEWLPEGLCRPDMAHQSGLHAANVQPRQRTALLVVTEPASLAGAESASYPLLPGGAGGGPGFKSQVSPDGKYVAYGKFRLYAAPGWVGPDPPPTLLCIAWRPVRQSCCFWSATAQDGHQRLIRSDLRHRDILDDQRLSHAAHDSSFHGRRLYHLSALSRDKLDTHEEPPLAFHCRAVVSSREPGPFGNPCPC
jgi:hypothetical protein